ncbi:VOC family protein [Bacillus sp. Marseille-Q3570]|uniref:VOC family protein n=1 Tax=Bacillus sp. Marseille-Q3570 TaxID=2963522 RepID=UPI0021B6E86A|nr:VOC family protein [Bacillus sp. Marseille-Q3570]
MIERIDTVCLLVNDVEISSKWYQDVLGFKEVFMEEGYRVLSVGTGSVPLTIEEGDPNPTPNQNYPIFFTKDIKQTYEKLKEHGVKVGEIHNDDVNNFFDFYDLDNNKLQVCFFE